MNVTILFSGLAIAISTLSVLPKGEISRSGITKMNCERLKQGMTRAEVEGVFGTPADKTADARNSTFTPPVTSLAILRVWKTKNIEVTAWFDDKDRLVEVYWDRPPGSGNLETPKQTKMP